ncbi:mini-ribonuclease 3 isoform X1 [Cinnamomum micranthum f. kanehirae]|uniref:Mini-ribonuclease 3 isoform X1 n=1 Tax=Cinnamomum micranthum f. kanehirae TaxID=337451 RepID=A0A443NGD9_9MAGN|nr:mini-ribonuclease 3 isoform X1 [Cinnamomum micranthum f. kanehirae]
MAATGFLSNCTVRVRSSYDLFPNPVTIPSPGTSKKTLTKKKPSPIPLKTTPPPLSDLFKKINDPLTSPVGKSQQVEEQYLGYPTWLPASPPKVKKPRSIYNAASLAYIGDGVYELYARRHFLFPPHSIEVYNDRVKAVVRCEAQDALLRRLLEDDYLTEEERDVLRWGKNIISGKTRTKKRAGVAVYSRASSLETLIGFLYLTDMGRLEDVMLKLGFTTGASDEPIVTRHRESK